MTLVELMVSMAVGLFVAAVATGLLVTAKSGYIAQADQAQLLDTGRHAMDVLTRTLQGAANLNWNATISTDVFSASDGPVVFGLDAKSLKGRGAAIESPVSRSVNGSDVLVLRLAGSGEGSHGDGSVLNCAGFGVGADDGENRDERGWSIFYVAEDAAGEPELYCKYPGEDGWTSQAIARGVESFQVLYAVDTDGDGYPNTLVNASAIGATGNEPAQTTAGTGARSTESASPMQWKNVVAVKVSLLVRGMQAIQGEKPDERYDLFGESYSNANAGRDKGVRIRVSELPKPVRNHARKVFSAMVWLRHQTTGA